MLNNQAEAYRSQGQYGTAEPLYLRALSIWERVLEPEHLEVAASRNNLAGLYAAQGQYGKAEPLYLRALTVREKTLGPDHPDIAADLTTLAEIYSLQSRYDKAESLYLRAVATWWKLLEPHQADLATVSQQPGRNLSGAGTLYQGGTTCSPGLSHTGAPLRARPR